MRLRGTFRLILSVLLSATAFGGCGYNYSFSKYAVPATLQFSQKNTATTTNSYAVVTKADFLRQPYASVYTVPFYVQNVGELPASGVKFTTDSAQYQVVSSTCTSIPVSPTFYCEVDITFSPTLFDTLTGNLIATFSNGKGQTVQTQLPMTGISTKVAFLKSGIVSASQYYATASSAAMTSAGTYASILTPNSMVMDTSINPSNGSTTNNTMAVHVVYSGSVYEAQMGLAPQTQCPVNSSGSYSTQNCVIPPASLTSSLSTRTLAATANLGGVPTAFQTSALPTDVFSIVSTNCGATDAQIKSGTYWVTPTSNIVINESCDVKIKVNPDFTNAPSPANTNPNADGNFIGELWTQYNATTTLTSVTIPFAIHGLNKVVVSNGYQIAGGLTIPTVIFGNSSSFNMYVINNTSPQTNVNGENFYIVPPTASSPSSAFLTDTSASNPVAISGTSVPNCLAISTLNNGITSGTALLTVSDPNYASPLNNVVCVIPMIYSPINLYSSLNDDPTHVYDIGNGSSYDLNQNDLVNIYYNFTAEGITTYGNKTSAPLTALVQTPAKLALSNSSGVAIDSSGNSIASLNESPVVTTTVPMGALGPGPNNAVPAFYPVTQTFVVKNLGNSNAGISSVTLTSSEGASTPFSLTGVSCSASSSGSAGGTIVSGGYCTYSVGFTPLDANISHTATITITYSNGITNDTSPNVFPTTFVATLTGTGSPAPYIVPMMTYNSGGTTKTTALGASGTPTTVAMGPYMFGQTTSSPNSLNNSAISFTIYGTDAINGGFNFTGQNIISSPYTVSSASTCAATIPSGVGRTSARSCSVVAAFAPPAQSSNASFDSCISGATPAQRRALTSPYTQTYSATYPSGNGVATVSSTLPYSTNVGERPCLYFEVQGSSTAYSGSTAPSLQGSSTPYTISTANSPTHIGQTSGLTVTVFNDSAYFASGVTAAQPTVATGPNSTDFGAGNTCTSVAASGVCNFSANFTPSLASNGAEAAALKFSYSDLIDSTAQLITTPVTAYASQDILAVAAPSPVPAGTTAGSSTPNFGSVYVGQSATTSLYLNVYGNWANVMTTGIPDWFSGFTSNLGFTNASSVATSVPVSVVNQTTSNCNTTNGNNALCSVSLTYSPTSIKDGFGSNSDLLNGVSSYVYNGSSGSNVTPLNFKIAATPLPLSITANPSTLSFGNVNAGTPSSLAVALTVTGAVANWYNGVTIPSSISSFVTVTSGDLSGNNGCSGNGGATTGSTTCYIKVTYTPQAIADSMSNINIALGYKKDSESPAPTGSINIAVSGTSVGVTVAENKASGGSYGSTMAFGSVNLTSSATAPAISVALSGNIFNNWYRGTFYNDGTGSSTQWHTISATSSPISFATGTSDSACLNNTAGCSIQLQYNPQTTSDTLPSGAYVVVGYWATQRDYSTTTSNGALTASNITVTGTAQAFDPTLATTSYSFGTTSITPNPAPTVVATFTPIGCPAGTGWTWFQGTNALPTGVTISNNTCSNLNTHGCASGGSYSSCTMTFSYSPAAAATFSNSGVNVQYYASAADAAASRLSNKALTLSGTAKALTPTLAASSLNFGQSYINPSPAPTVVASIAPSYCPSSGTAWNWFSGVNTANLPTGVTATNTCSSQTTNSCGSCTVTFTYAPTAVGSFTNTTVNLQYYPTLASSQSSTATNLPILLSGSAINHFAVLGLNYWNGSQLVALSSTQDFGRVFKTLPTGSTASTYVDQVYVLTNSGSAAVTLTGSSVALTSSDGSSFSLINSGSSPAAPALPSGVTSYCSSLSSLASGASCAISMRFKPTTLGKVTASLSVNYTDSGTGSASSFPTGGQAFHAVGQVPVQVAAGGQNTCIIDEAQQALCWGDNTYGQLGQGSTSAVYTSPNSMSRISFGSSYSGVYQIAVGGHGYACAILIPSGSSTVTSGPVTCWGNASNGMLGYSASGTVSSPGATPTLVNLGTGITAKSISAGYDHTCALLSTNGVYCWGNNASEELGSTSVSSTTGTPSFSGVAGTPAGVAAGISHSCAVTSTGKVACWGDDSYGQVGIMPSGVTTSAVATPNSITYGSSGVALAKAVYTGSGNASTCILLADGSLRCFGSTSSSNALGTFYGVLGACVARPSGWNNYNSTAANCADNSYTNATDKYGMGTNDLGSNLDLFALFTTSSTSAYSTSLWSINTTLTNSVAIGGFHGCAVFAANSSHSSGAVGCWGSNYYGELGTGTTDLGIPQAASDMTTGFDAAILGTASAIPTGVAAGGLHSCAVLSDNTVRCWGEGKSLNPNAPDNANGLANGSSSSAMDSSSPVVSYSGYTSY